MVPIYKSLLERYFVNKFWFKGKGILVPVFIFTSFLFIMGSSVFIERHFGIQFIDKFAGIILGFMLIVSGVLTRVIGMDYIIKDDQKVEIDMNNQFMFIKMKTVGQIFVVLGVGFVISWIFRLLA